MGGRKEREEGAEMPRPVAAVQAPLQRVGGHPLKQPPNGVGGPTPKWQPLWGFSGGSGA